MGVVTQQIGVKNGLERESCAFLFSPHRIPSPARRTTRPGHAAVAFLTGAILARHRALPIRLLLLPTLFIPTFAHFLPRTSSNIRAYASELEEHYAPGVAEKHEIGKAHAGMAWARLAEGGKGVRESVRGGMPRAVEKGGAGGREGDGGKVEKVLEETMEDLQKKVEETKVEVEEQAKDKVA
ncbi:MICOS complex subunit [Mycena venus]|uniref:MICOS complex subunit n=1 Tax=Mycena venus TaxID=2733690 RepID=A0A8H6Y0N2_9AGAR|nr:MICOS complex subunit [Mycena venus]